MKVPVVSSSWNIKQSKTFHRFCEVAKYILSYFVLWKRGIQRIGGHFGGGVQSYFLFLRFLVILNFLSCLLIAAFVLIPSIVFRSMSFNSTITLTVNLTGRNTVSLGFMEYSYLFYGYYNNSVIESNGFSYNIPLAYLLTAAFYFLFSLSGFSTNIENTLLKLKKKAASLTLGQTVSLYALRVFLNLVVLILIGATLYGIAEATQFSQSRKTTGFVGLLLQYLPSMVITASNFVVPLLCDKISLLEKYSPIILCIGHFRAVFLRLVSLGVLLYTLWEQITCKGEINSENCTPCNYYHDQYKCWETRVGQEMYKLTLFDFLITIATLILVEFPRRIVVDHCSCKLTQWVGRQEFLVAPNVLALVYSQTVVWTGALFCPLLPFINTIKFIFFYYCKKITLFQNCQPATRNFRSTTSNLFFLLVLLFGWMLSNLSPFFFGRINPSYGCGPFRFYTAMWEVVPGAVEMLSSTNKEFLFYIGSQKFSIPLFIFSWSRDKQFLVRQIEELNATMQKLQHEPQQPQRETEPFYHAATQWNQHNNYAFDPHEDPKPY
uniref:Transmembrane channel-like protein n=1 Tax=Sinocyclocheilus grahami TaxID=75366 RepID=A0A672LJX8_SINGR